MLRAILIISSINFFVSCEYNISTESFPDDFLFGVGSSAYQTEGAWNDDGKTQSLWDYITHKESELIADKSNGDVACDSYNKFKEDLELLKKLGVNFYRFSLSWNRILPTGYANRVNKAGIDYYNNIINELLANDITPIVTILHRDIPLSIYRLGGFGNDAIVDLYEDYARIVFQHFGDRVKLWVTINDPKAVCQYGHGAIGEELEGIADYYCAYNLVRTHARTYKVYNDTFREAQQGKLGIAITCPWFEPATNSTEDIQAADRVMQFQCGMYGHPIYSNDGDFPEVVKEFVGNRSKEEGFNQSRVHPLASHQIPYVKGSYDFIGLNHYTAYLVADTTADPIENSSVEKDQRATLSQDPSWHESSLKDFKSVPWAFRKILKWIKDNYEDPEIYVTENGFADSEPQHDEKRIHYHTYYLSNLLDAIHIDKVQVKGYVAWSFLDSFEFYHGYTQAFGLHHVDFSDPNKSRTPKDSASFYSEVIKTKKLPQNITTH